MATALDLEIPLANGGHVQITIDPASGGFLLLNILKADATVDSSTPLTQVQATSLSQAIQGVNQARSALIRAGI
jgi:hypothetical protein